MLNICPRKLLCCSIACSSVLLPLPNSALAAEYAGNAADNRSNPAASPLTRLHDQIGTNPWTKRTVSDSTRSTGTGEQPSAGPNAHGFDKNSTFAFPSSVAQTGLQQNTLFSNGVPSPRPQEVATPVLHNMTQMPASAPALLPAGTPLQNADPAESYSSITANHLQSVGEHTDVSQISESTGIVGNPMQGLINFKKVNDPDNGSKSAFLMQANYNDPDTAGAGAKRTELYWSSSDGYTPGTIYWQAFRIRIGDNIKNLRSDDGAILWQIHDGADVGLSPPMALNATGGGSGASLQWVLRYSSNATLDRSTIQTRIAHEQIDYPTNKWITYVIQFKPQYASNKGAFFRVWQNGELIVNDTQPNDYNTGQELNRSRQSYQKLGVYHYYQNRWASGDYLTAYYKGLVTYKDDSIITELTMRNLIESR